MKEFTLHTSTTTQLGIDHFDIIKENQVFKHNRTGCEGVTLHDLGLSAAAKTQINLRWSSTYIPRDLSMTQLGKNSCENT